MKRYHKLPLDKVNPLCFMMLLERSLLVGESEKEEEEEEKEEDLEEKSKGVSIECSHCLQCLSVPIGTICSQ